MALIVETGMNVANADSFVTLAEVRAFALSRGKSLAAVADLALEAQIREAHDYLVSLEYKFQGFRTYIDQTLPFPRAGIVLYSRSVHTNVIPQTLKNAVSQLVIELQTREALPSTDGKVVVSESVGPISTTYALTGSGLQNPSFPRVDAYLLPLFNSGGGLTVTRV